MNTVKVGHATYETMGTLVARTVRQQYRKLRRDGMERRDAAGVIMMTFLCGTFSAALPLKCVCGRASCTECGGPAVPRRRAS
jgi:hypothetical protein